MTCVCASSVGMQSSSPTISSASFLDFREVCPQQIFFFSLPNAIYMYILFWIGNIKRTISLTRERRGRGSFSFIPQRDFKFYFNLQNYNLIIKTVKIFDLKKNNPNNSLSDCQIFFKYHKLYSPPLPPLPSSLQYYYSFLPGSLSETIL